jgi:hypothetical protein
MQVLLCTYGSIRTIRSMARPHPTTSVRPSIRPSLPSIPSIVRLHANLQHTSYGYYSKCTRAAGAMQVLLYIHMHRPAQHGPWLGPTAPHPSVCPSLPSVHREIIPCKSAAYTTNTTLNARARPVRCRYFSIHMDRHALDGPWLGPTPHHPSVRPSFRPSLPSVRPFHPSIVRLYHANLQHTSNGY